MTTLNEDKIQAIEIDLEQLKSNQVNENLLGMFGGVIKMILDQMMSSPHRDFTARTRDIVVSGRRSDVNSFARALGNEKAYLESAREHGLDNEKTYKSKTTLDRAIRGFEKSTGLKWPVK